MRRYLFCAMLSLSCSSVLLAADGEPAADALATAFEAELAGDVSSRNSNLQRALSIDPDNVAARALLGQVKTKQGWMDVDALIDQWASDRSIAGYNQLRRQVQATPQGQLMLARYCSKHDLRERADFHWRLILATTNRSREAARALGLKRHRGVFMTEEQIARFEATRKKLTAADNRVRELVSAAKGEDAAEALEQIRDIRDEFAIESLLRTALQKGIIGEAALQALIDNPSPQASNALARIAIFADDEATAKLAAESLRSRPSMEFAPTLLGRLATPIHVSSQLTQLDDRGLYSIRLHREGVQFDSAHQIHGITGLSEKQLRPIRRLAARVQRGAAVTNRQVADSNERVFNALELATEQQFERHPQVWWDWWAQQNDIYRPQTKLEFETYTLRDQTSPDGFSSSAPQLEFRPPVVGGECFLPGTLVWTDRGRERIELLRAGDRVLTCHPESGELSFRHILMTTVRPAKDTTRLRLRGEDLVSTDGHPLWVIGEGWKMAKDVAPGDRLHGVRESLLVDAVEKGPKSQVYNLIVDGVSTYFVGNRGALAHDNTLRQPTRCDIPGRRVAVNE